MVFYSFAGLLPQGSLYMYTNDPIQIGVIALPNGFAQVICGGILTLLMGKFGHLKLQVIICLIFQTVFTAVGLHSLERLSQFRQLHSYYFVNQDIS